MEQDGAKNMDKGMLFKVGESSPSNCIKRQVEIEQLYLSVSFIHGFKGRWVEAGGTAHSQSLGRVAKLQPLCLMGMLTSFIL